MTTPDRFKRSGLAVGLGLALLAGVAFALASSSRGTPSSSHPNILPAGGSGGGSAGGSGGGGSVGSCQNTLCATTIASCGWDQSLVITGAKPTGANQAAQAMAPTGPICPQAPACPTDANGTYACVGTSTVTCDYKCVLTCNAGYNNCAGGACVPDTASACGSSCSNCNSSAPTNSTASCTAGSCAYACNAGYHNCGGASVSCAALGTTSCGNACTNCAAAPYPAPNSTTTSCSVTSGSGAGGVCECTCNPGYWPAGAAACSSLNCASQSFSTIY